MKTIPKLMLAALLVLGCGEVVDQAQGEPIELFWPANPPAEHVEEYVLWKLEGENWIEVGRTAETTFVLQDLTPGEHTFALSARNMIGESTRNEPVTIPGGVPTPPGAIRFRVWVPGN